MLSDRFYSSLEKLFHVYNILGVCSIEWDGRCRLFKKCEKVNKMMALTYTMLFSILTFTLFQLGRFWRNYSSFNIVFTFFIATSLAGVSFLFTNGSGEFCSILNSFLIFLKKINRKFLNVSENCFKLNKYIPWQIQIIYKSTFCTGLYVPRHRPNTSKYNKFIESSLVLIFCGTLFLMSVQCFFILWFPRAPMLYGNVLPDSNENPIIALHLVLLASQIYLSFVSYLNFYITWCSPFIYGTLVIPFIVKELKLGKRKYRSISKTRESPTLIHVYRSVQVLHEVLNNYVGGFLIVMQALVTILFCFAGFMAIKHRKQVSGPALLLLDSWALFGPSAWCAVLILGGYLHSNANKLLNSWKHFQRSWKYAAERRIMGRFRRSCRPLCIAYRKMYVLKRVSVLLFVKGLSRGIMRALLTLEQSSKDIV